MSGTRIPAWVNGRLVPVDKLDAHRRGLRHMAVSVFVLCDGEVLLQQRALGKYHTPGLWANTCCTHPHWRESPETCAERRLREELGIAGIVPTHRGQVEYRADVGGGLTEHELVDVFVAEVTPGLSVTPNPEEVMAIRWVPMPDLLKDVARQPDPYTPWLRIYLDRFAPQIFENWAELCAKRA